MNLEINKIASDCCFIGSLVSKGFVDEIIKLSYEDSPIVTETSMENDSPAPKKKRCINEECSEYNKVVETTSQSCQQCGENLEEVS